MALFVFLKELIHYQQGMSILERFVEKFILKKKSANNKNICKIQWRDQDFLIEGSNLERGVQFVNFT